MTGESREFTLEEARALLADLREAVVALQQTQVRLRELRAELELIARAHLGNGHVQEHREAELRLEQRSLAEVARRQIDGIHATGAEIKGIDDGLLDFPTRVEGTPAYWCWREGEADIQWWHPRDSGFSGRRRIEDDRAH